MLPDLNIDIAGLADDMPRGFVRVIDPNEPGEFYETPNGRRVPRGRTIRELLELHGGAYEFDIPVVGVPGHSSVRISLKGLADEDPENTRVVVGYAVTNKQIRHGRA